MNNVRMKIAAGATVLGLGGLAGFALGSNDAPPASAAGDAAAPHQKPKVTGRWSTRPSTCGAAKGKAAPRWPAHRRGAIVGGPGGRTGASYAASAPAASARTSSSARGDLRPPVRATRPPPVSTHTSGGGGSGSGSSYEDDGGSEHESEAGGDD